MERPEKGAGHTCRFHKPRNLISVLVLGVHKTKSVSLSLVNWHLEEGEERKKKRRRRSRKKKKRRKKERDMKQVI